MQNTDRGTYIDLDGRPAVRFERVYPHPVDTVWAHVSEPALLSRWFPATVELEPVVGGTVSFRDDPHQPEATGTVLAYHPPHRLAFTWGDDELHLDLEPTDDGGCRLRLTNVLAERDAAARNASGWQVCLGVLDDVLAGRPTGGPHGDDVPSFEPIYDSYVAAGMPHGAPIPDDA